MITANAICSSTGHIMLEFIIPGERTEYGMARDESEARRMVYFRNRKYICEKLQSWLIQRRHAIQPYPKQPEYSQKLSEILTLLAAIDYFKTASFKQVCAFVAKAEKSFHLVAPHTLTSKQYQHYSSTILPIINFCKYIKGE